MEANPPQIPGLLKSTHLFSKLSQAALEDLADQFEVSTYSANTVIFKQGDMADSFYMILDGGVKVLHQKRGNTRQLASLVKGDYFGEEALIAHRPRMATIITTADTTLLRLNSVQFNEVLRDTPHLRDYLQVAISTHHHSQSKSLSWLNPGEVVYVMARKHPFFLWTNLIMPGAALLASLILAVVLYLYVLPGMATALVIGGFGLLVSIAWLIWNAIDWSNDYYIVTNQRVVWLEVVAGVYDSRMEAPLTTILSVGIHTTHTGRIVGYGNVTVRTYTGPIPFHRIGNPEQVAAIIEEHAQRSKVTVREQEGKKIEQAIRERLGLALPAKDQAKAGAKKPAPQGGLLNSFFRNFYNMRIEEGGVVTYRKHWFVLLENTWVQMGIVAFSIALFGIRLFKLIEFPSLTATAVFSLIIFLIGISWYLYSYEDWRNDIYQVTADQIIDIEKKPFGTEQKKSAPLESILSIEFERLGFLGIVFNFGTVKITVGGTKFDFFNVYNPSQVQREIFQRMEERKAKKKEAETEAERERMSAWLATYHRGLEQGVFKEAPNQPPPVSPTVTKKNEPDDEESGESQEAYY